VAVQTLLAREMAGGTDDDENNDDNGGIGSIVRAQRVRHLINGSILVGGFVAGALSLLTYFQRDGVLRGLTTNTAIREASAAVFPVVLITQGELKLRVLPSLSAPAIVDVYSQPRIFFRFFAPMIFDSSQRSRVSRQWHYYGWP
jgi:hypothetical protein